MFSVSTKDRTKFLEALKATKKEINDEALEVYKGFVRVAYSIVVDETPQWTGHAAAQWNIGVSYLDVTRSHLYLKDHLEMSKAVRDRRPGPIGPKKKGHHDAVDEAKRRQAGQVEQIKLDDIIFISNNVEDLLTGAYAQKLEENPNNYLRLKNQPGHMVARTIGWFNSRVALLTPADIKKFRIAKLSDTGVMETF